MKRYQVFARKGGDWVYGDTFTSPAIAWAGLMLIRAKGMVGRVIIVQPGQDVCAHG